MACCGNCKYWDKKPGSNMGKCEFPVPFWLRPPGAPTDNITGRIDGKECLAWKPRRNFLLGKVKDTKEKDNG